MSRFMRRNIIPTNKADELHMEEEGSRSGRRFGSIINHKG